MADYRVVTSDFVNLHISTSNDESSFNEKRFPKDITISELKAKLELITGGNCTTMQVEAYDKEDKLVCYLSDENALLGSYPLDNGMRLHVIDKFCVRNELDFENVEKYEMAPEMYAQRTDTVRAFLLKNKLGQYNEEYAKKKQQEQEEEEKHFDSIIVGSRCKVTVLNQPTKLGVVLYKGPVEQLSGQWVGVKYDEPLGKHDGTFKGKQYFKCPPKYGSFVKPSYVTTGDFPEEIFDFEEEEI
ncbi:hypothetical protein RN001_004928 [Aquatica leii]|uniref:CAP-Gly domain-containing protein n=1 Tax=Aquatica leii TaxID=1421715 RepID=A0AAN7SI86_9COLE|nr:hypothetical protein RN001_004928 [Aquatica leii]